MHFTCWTCMHFSTIILIPLYCNLGQGRQKKCSRFLLCAFFLHIQWNFLTWNHKWKNSLDTSYYKVGTNLKSFVFLLWIVFTRTMQEQSVWVYGMLITIIWGEPSQLRFKYMVPILSHAPFIEKYVPKSRSW